MNYGLAYVERYDPTTNVFTLHGPVSAEASGVRFCTFGSIEELTPSEQQILLDADSGDHRKRVLAEQVRREHQNKFRKILLDAYCEKCAVTGTNIPEVLQAAHIDPYRGKKSQVASNGLLLRSDIHLLYDSHLLTVEPGSNILVVSKRITASIYGQLDGMRITTPKDPLLKPNDALLEMHMREFHSIEKLTA